MPVRGPGSGGFFFGDSFGFTFSRLLGYLDAVFRQLANILTILFNFILAFIFALIAVFQDIFRTLFDLIPQTIRDWFGALDDFFRWLVKNVRFLIDQFNEFIKPAIDAINAALTAIRTAIALVEGRINDILGTVAPRLKESIDALRREFGDLLRQLEGITGLISGRVADAISDFRLELDRRFRDISEFFEREIGERVLEVVRTVDRRVRDVEAAFATQLGRVSGRLDPLEGLTIPTIEKPQLLTRETTVASVGRSAVDVADILAGSGGARPSAAIVRDVDRLPGQGVIDKTRAVIEGGLEAAWREISEYVDETVTNIEAGRFEDTRAVVPRERFPGDLFFETEEDFNRFIGSDEYWLR
jgi:hypothetical protein